MPEEATYPDPALGIPKSTASPLIALIATSISALVVVLVVLAREKKESLVF